MSTQPSSSPKKSATTKTPRRGRPPVHTPDEQWERIVEAFEQMLSQKELDAHSMGDIAKMAGMSKRTLYSIVRSKEALVVRVIEHARHPAVSLLEAPVTSAANARETLEKFLFQWMEAAYSLATINIIRMAMDERRTFPGIGASYIAAGGDFLSARLKSWLRSQVGQGYLVSDNPDLLADLLGASLVSRTLMSVAFGHRAPPSRAQIKSRVKAVLAFSRI